MILIWAALWILISILAGSIPQFIGSELFKQGPRPAAMSFAGLMNWIANFAVGISFPAIQVLKLSISIKTLHINIIRLNIFSSACPKVEVLSLMSHSNKMKWHQSLTIFSIEHII